MPPQIDRQDPAVRPQTLRYTSHDRLFGRTGETWHQHDPNGRFREIVMIDYSLCNNPNTGKVRGGQNLTIHG